MRLIDADAIPFLNDPLHPHIEGFQSVIKMAIDNMPTIDAIPAKWIFQEVENPARSDAYRNALDEMYYQHWKNK